MPKADDLFVRVKRNGWSSDIEVENAVRCLPHIKEFYYVSRQETPICYRTYLDQTRGLDDSKKKAVYKKLYGDGTTEFARHVESLKKSNKLADRNSSNESFLVGILEVFAKNSMRNEWAIAFAALKTYGYTHEKAQEISDKARSST